MVDSGGIIHTVAGDGNPSYSGDGGPAIQAELFWPEGIVVDPATGDVLWAEAKNNVIRELLPDGTIKTYSGNVNIAADIDGPIATATFNGPVVCRVAPTAACTCRTRAVIGSGALTLWASCAPSPVARCLDIVVTVNQPCWLV
jgi:hypothetical protein